MAYSEIEQEVIILKAVTDMLQGMVNHSLLEPVINPQEATVQFKSNPQAALFNILLVDFLSPVTGSPRPFDLRLQPQQGYDKAADTTFLFYLRQIIAKPLVGHDVTALKEHVEAFATWLEETTHVEHMTLPSARVADVPFSIQRLRWLKLCGNIAKHSFARLAKDQENLRDALTANGVTLQQGQVFAVLEDFLKCFHEDLFLFHTTTIVEFLNNIRWAIYDYLKLAHLISETEIAVGIVTIPTFDPPPGVNDELSKEFWWSMMWQHQRRPFYPRFTADYVLKRRS